MPPSSRRCAFHDDLPPSWRESLYRLFNAARIASNCCRIVMSRTRSTVTVTVAGCAGAMVPLVPTGPGIVSPRMRSRLCCISTTRARRSLSVVRGTARRQPCRRCRARLAPPLRHGDSARLTAQRGDEPLRLARCGQAAAGQYCPERRSPAVHLSVRVAIGPQHPASEIHVQPFGARVGQDVRPQRGDIDARLSVDWTGRQDASAPSVTLCSCSLCTAPSFISRRTISISWAPTWNIRAPL